MVVKNGSVSAVKTSMGTIECEKFVNCAGYWARSVGYASDPKVQVIFIVISSPFLFEA